MRLITVLLLFTFLETRAQNLVLNPGFEKKTDCPVYISSLIYCQDWTNPTAGTPDYFHTCGVEKPKDVTEVGIPKNTIGTQAAKEGNAYSGIILYNETHFWREYLQGKFSEKLVKGGIYRFSMYVSLADFSKFASSNFQVYFSESPVISDNLKIFRETKAYNGTMSKPVPDKIPLPYKPQLELTADIVTEKKEWVLLSGTFTAKGNERFFTIGNFNTDKETELKAVNIKRNRQQHCYYYIDDISAELIGQSQELVNVSTFDTLKPGSLIVLENLYFENDKAIIQNKSFEELDELILFLTENPWIRIAIYGHTDDQAGDDYNKELSTKRAAAVAEYLTKKVDRTRITFIGFGESKPVADNSTEEGRKKNRRVELEILK